MNRRRAVNQAYRDLFDGVGGIAFMPEADYARATFWLTCITLDDNEFGASPTEVREALEADNIEARPVWKPLPRQPAFEPVNAVGGTVADDLFARGLCLPSGSSMSDNDIERVAGIVMGCRR